MNALIKQILCQRSIVEYLEQKGHSPVRRMGNGRLSYHCPLPDHDENKPSFIVWTQSEYENFYCFGCLRHNNIIHLVSFMEGISFKEALKRLSDGMEVSDIEEGEFAIQQLDRDISKLQDNPIYTPSTDFATTILYISSMCRHHMAGVDFDTNEIRIIDKFWHFIDDKISDYAFEELEDILSFLPNVLTIRQDVYRQELLEKKKQDYENAQTSF